MTEAPAVFGVDEAFKEILKGGGITGAFVIILSVAVVVLFLRLMASEKARITEGKSCSTAQEAAYEKRLEEAQRMTAALERNTASNLTLISSSDARNLAFQEMVKGFAVVAESLKAEAQQNRETLDRIERRQEKILDGQRARA